MFNKKWKGVMICFSVACLLGFMGHAFTVLASDQSPNQKAAQKGIEKRLDDSLGMPILKGDLWQQMTHDSKIGFIWGFGHVVSIEHFLMEKYPELKRDSFVEKVVEGMDNIPMNEVIVEVDRYYETHPDEMDKPVTSVLWDTLIRPNIKTGIAGRQLKNRP